MKDFNFFLPYIESNRIDRKTLYGVTAGSTIIVVLLGLYIINVFRIKTISKNITQINTQINSPEVVKQKNKLDEAKKKYELVKQYYDIVDNANGGVLSNNVINTQLIYDISSTIPKNVSFTNMSISSGDISIQGKASARTEIAELEHNMKALSNIDNVYVSVISSGKNDNSSTSENYVFSLKCSIKGVKSNEDNK